MYNPNNIKIGDAVKLKPWDEVGMVVGSAFGKPEKGMLRIQLSCGLTYDTHPVYLKKVKIDEI